MIKFPYQSTMRSGHGQTQTVQWLIANPGAKLLPYPTAFGSSRWNVEPTDDGGIGEIPEVFPPKSVGYVNPNLFGDHVCGTPDQWANGWLPTDPLPPVDQHGVPKCCGITAGAYNDSYSDAFDT